MKTAHRNHRNCNRLVVQANTTQGSDPNIKYCGPSRPHPAVSRNHSTTASPLHANHLWHTVEQTQHQAATALLDYLRQGKSAWERDIIIGQTILSQQKQQSSSSQQNNHHGNTPHYHQKPHSTSSFTNQTVNAATRPWKRYYAQDPDDPDDAWGSSNASINQHQQNSIKQQQQQQQHTSTSYAHTSDSTANSTNHQHNTSPWEEEQQEWTRAWSSWWDDAKKQHGQGETSGFGGHGGYYYNQQEKYHYYQQQQQQQNYYNSSSSSSSSYHNSSNNILPLGMLPPAPPAGSTKHQIADWTAHRDISLLLQGCNGDIIVFAQSLNVAVKEQGSAKAAYRACLLKYHPDRLGGASVEEQCVGVYVTRALVYLFKKQ